MNEYRAKRYYQSNAVANEYDRERFSTWYGRMAHETEAHALVAVAEKYFKSPGTVLDVPCGTGRLLDVLTNRGFQVIGGDISEAMILIARARFAGNPAISFQKIEAEHLPFPDNFFDYLTSYRLMCHLPHETQKSVLKEMIRVTRKVLVVNYHFSCFSPLYLFNQTFRRQYLSPYPLKESELRKALGGWQGIELAEIRKLSWYERSSALVVFRKS